MTKIVNISPGSGLQVVKYDIEYKKQNIVSVRLGNRSVNLTVSESEILSNVLQNQINEYREKLSADVLYSSFEGYQEDVPF